MKSQYLQHLGFAIILLSALTSCIPNTTTMSSESPESSLSEDSIRLLLSHFQQTLNQRGIQIDRVQGFDYNGNNPDAFTEAINSFYQNNTGFCPLANNAFTPSEQYALYLTLAGDGGRNIRGFIYDLRRRPKLDYIYFDARASENIPTITCQTKAKGIS